jgi:hypothetical protein
MTDTVSETAVPGRTSTWKMAGEGAFTLWLTFVTIRYAQTSLKSIASPLNPGSDKEWLIFLLIAVSILSISLILPSLLRVACLSVFAIAIAIFVLSGTLIAAFLALWFIAVAYVWGVWFLRLTDVDTQDLIQSIAIGIPLGLLIPVSLGFTLACIHALTVTSLWTGLAVLTLLQMKTILSLPKPSWELRNIPWDVSFPLLVTLPVLLLNLMWAVAPEIHFDANNYHLAVPKIYLAAGRFVDLPYFFTSYYTRFAEMMLAFGLALNGPAAAKVLSFICSLVAACCVYSIGKEAFDERTGAWGAAFFYSTPIVGWLSGTTYIDNIAAMFLAAAALATLKWCQNRSQYGWLWIIAPLAGMMIATKMNVGFGLPVLVGIVCWDVRRLSIRRVAIFLMLIGVVAAPWYAMSYHWTGNPVFPMWNGVFKSPLWNLDNRIPNATDLGIGTSFGALARLPFRLVFNTDLFGEASPRGAAGLALLLAFPFAILLFQIRRAAAVLLSMAAIYFVLWSYTFQYTRYLVPVLPVICVLGIATAFYFDSDGRWSTFRKGILAAGLIMQFPSAPVQYWNIPERFPIRLAFGRETRDAFLNRALVGYTAAIYLNGITRSSDRVIGVGVEQTRFYLNAPLETVAQATLHSKLREVVGKPPDRALLETLLSDGFTYLLITRDALQIRDEAYPYLTNEFLNRFADVQFMDHYVVLYRLHS